MRLRQICLVAEDLKSSLEMLSDLLASPVIYHDPEVAQFGLENGLIMTGGDFVEVVSPLAEAADTAAGRHLARYGDSFYMAIFQCADAGPHISHIKNNGVRGVFDIDVGGVRATHFHPKDFGGAIVSVDSMGRDDWQSPHAYWEWAKWPRNDDPLSDIDTSVGALAGLQVSMPTPSNEKNDSDLQNRWAQFLQRPSQGDRLLFDGAEIIFQPANTPSAKISDIYLHSGRDNINDIHARAERLGLPMENGGFSFGGVIWHFGASPYASEGAV